MEMRSRVRLSSTWEARGDIRAVLYIINSSGILLDEPLSAELCATPLSLCAPTSDPTLPCQLHVDLSKLRGYTSSQLELTSTARTTELYRDGGEEYVGTVRGTAAGNCEHNGSVQRLYCCHHTLPSDGTCQELSIKLLSLRGREEVLVDKIQLVVAENHGGTASPPRKSALSSGQPDMQQLLGSLPVHSMPPFLQTLVSSLQHLGTQGGSEHSAISSTDNRPAELTQLMLSLQQLRPPTAKASETENTRNGVETEISAAASEGDEAGTRSGGGEIEGGCSKEFAALEVRLRLYLDEKFEQLEKKLERRLEELCAASHGRLLQEGCGGENSRSPHVAEDQSLD